MSLRTYLVVALAVVFGVSSAMGITLLVRDPYSAVVEKVSIVVAAVDVDRFVPLTATHLALKEIPKDTAPPGTLTRIEDAVDRIAVVPVSKHDYIVDQLLSKKGSRTVGAAIPPGKRAIAIQGSNVSGFIQPGDKVDIMVAVKDKSGDYKALTLFTMIDVMAVNGSLVPTLDYKTDGKEPHSVNVLLTQEQAEDLEKAQKVGTIRLALRSAGDTHPAQVTRIADLKLNVPEEKQEAPGVVTAHGTDDQPAADLPQIRTIRGLQPGVVILKGDSGHRKSKTP